MTGNTRTGRLVVGGLHLLNGSAPVEPADPVVLAAVADPRGGEADNTVVLAWDGLGPAELTARTVGAGEAYSGRADGSRLFPGMLAGGELRAAVDAVGAPADPLRPLAPLFYLRDVPGEQAVHVYTQIRFRAEDACFIRLTARPLPTAGAQSLDWLAEAVRLHAAQSMFLNNHQLYYRKCFPGHELEYKYTLGAPVDIWTHTVEVCNRLAAGSLPGYVVEYRDEFQTWDYLNHLFEVTAPAQERGYVSFIPTTDGKCLVKRKWYVEDGFDRRETHTYGVDVHDDGGYERWVREELGVSATRLPSFRRVRYDVNFESLRTGHVYGLFFDHSSLLADPAVTLNQCELEYLRSRTAIEPDEKDALAEMAQIAGWLESYLQEQGLNSTPGYYSKRTFLKDVVASRPDLSPEGAR